MLTSVCLIPATPLLVPEIGGAAADETAGLRAQVVAAVEAMGEHADRWFVIGAAESGDEPAESGVIVPYPPHSGAGTFSGFGPDVRVSLSGARGSADAGPGGSSAGSPAGEGNAAADATMPLPLLLAGWLRGAVRPGVRPAEPIVGLRAGCGAAPEVCAKAGARLRADIDAAADCRTGVLVVGDGPTTLTAKAPGAFDERAQPVADRIARAFADGDGAALAQLEPGLCAEIGVGGRAAWQVVAGIVGDTAVRVVGASTEWPYGVGYHTALWLL